MSDAVLRLKEPETAKAAENMMTACRERAATHTESARARGRCEARKGADGRWEMQDGRVQDPRQTNDSRPTSQDRGNSNANMMLKSTFKAEGSRLKAEGSRSSQG
eukprot:2858309-Rhodomonas_salina.6